MSAWNSLAPSPPSDECSYNKGTKITLISLSLSLLFVSPTSTPQDHPRYPRAPYCRVGERAPGVSTRPLATPTARLQRLRQTQAQQPHILYKNKKQHKKRHHTTTTKHHKSIYDHSASTPSDINTAVAVPRRGPRHTLILLILRFAPWAAYSCSALRQHRSADKLEDFTLHTRSKPPSSKKRENLATKSRRTYYLAHITSCLALC